MLFIPLFARALQTLFPEKRVRVSIGLQSQDIANLEALKARRGFKTNEDATGFALARMAELTKELARLGVDMTKPVELFFITPIWFGGEDLWLKGYKMRIALN